MIIYYTGTGNSKHAAKKIQSSINDDCLDLFSRLKTNDTSPLYSEKPYIIVTPTYAWRIPRVVEKLLEKTPLEGNRKIYFVLTCGDSIGNAGKYLKEFANKKNMNYMGTTGIVMPENYITLFKAPDEETARRIIKLADHKLDIISKKIQKEEMLDEKKVSIIDRLSSSFINRIFYPLFVSADRFYVKDSCIGCNKCKNVCPLGNIQIIDNKPVWGKNCTQCMACISSCPEKAIEYGKRSIGKIRYICPETLPKEE